MWDSLCGTKNNWQMRSFCGTEGVLYWKVGASYNNDIEQN